MTRRYLSARRLGISTAEHRALVRVSEIIGASPNRRDCRGFEMTHSDFAPPGIVFDMSRTCVPSTCGTVACVGGHVGLIMQGVDMNEEFPVVTLDQRVAAEAYVEAVGKNPGSPVFDLYWPNAGIMDAATTRDARIAVLNFLTIGEAEWEDVVESRLAADRAMALRLAETCDEDRAYNESNPEPPEDRY